MLHTRLSVIGVGSLMIPALFVTSCAPEQAASGNQLSGETCFSIGAHAAKNDPAGYVCGFGESEGKTLAEIVAKFKVAGGVSEADVAAVVEGINRGAQNLPSAEARTKAAQQFAKVLEEGMKAGKTGEQIAQEMANAERLFDMDAAAYGAYQATQAGATGSGAGY